MVKTLGILQAAILALPILLAAPGNAGKWSDRDCKRDKDENGNRVEVCRDNESIGIFWDDGAYVNGWCDGRQYEIDYTGISKKDALTWVDYYCE